jgi:hypothetical protein
VVRRLEGSLHPWAFVSLLGITLAAQFGVSTEVFATTALFGAIALLLGYVFDRDGRSGIRRCAALIGLGYGLACLLVSPLLYTAFALPHPAGLASTGPSVSPMSGVRTYLRLTPTRPRSGLLQTGSGGSSLLTVLFVLPLLAILLHLAWRRRREPVVRALFVTALIALLFSAGIVVVGSRDLPTPWALMNRIPLVRLIRPQRLTMFAWLVASVGVGVWLSDRHSSRRRWAAGTLAAAALLPAFWLGSWTSVIQTPRFIAASRPYLASGTNVAVVAGPGPVSLKLNDLAFPTVWQVESNFSFRLANAYVGSFPPTLPLAVRRFEFGAPLLPGQESMVRAWLKQADVGAVLVLRPTPTVVRPLQQLLGTEPIWLGDVALLFVPDHAP